jgi:hypothetical protein
MTAKTASTKLNTIINQATRLGLRVDLTEHEDDYGCQTYVIEIHSNFEGHANMLEQILTYDYIRVVATRWHADNKPRAFRLYATKIGWCVDPTSLKPTRIHSWVDMMADSINRYTETKAA